ncbi:hypothetical protein QQM79_03160 [Marinobacteraceae bacterium S3BR75-40.1]
MKSKNIANAYVATVSFIYFLVILLLSYLPSNVWGDGVLSFFDEVNSFFPRYCLIKENVDFVESAIIGFFVSNAFYPFFLLFAFWIFPAPDEERMKSMISKDSGVLGFYVIVCFVFALCIPLYLPGAPGSGPSGRFNYFVFGSKFGFSLGLFLLRFSSAFFFVAAFHYIQAIRIKLN